jgi:hypothetical protein
MAWIWGMGVVIVLVGAIGLGWWENQPQDRGQPTDHGPAAVITLGDKVARCEHVLAWTALDRERRLMPGPTRKIRCVQEDGYFDIHSYNVTTIKWPKP